MRCQQCGAELANGAAFCGSCGADTRATSPYGYASGGDGSGGYPSGGYPSAGYGSAGYPSAGYGSGGYGPGGYPPPGQRRGSAALWVALALFAVGVASVVAWFALNRSSDEQPVATRQHARRVSRMLVWFPMRVRAKQGAVGRYGRLREAAYHRAERAPGRAPATSRLVP